MHYMPADQQQGGMIRGTTLPRQALPMLAAVALLLPAIIALAVWLNAQQDAQRVAVQRNAMAAAQQMLALSDAEAIADGRQLRMIANSPAAHDNDLGRLTRFFDLALQNNPQWNGLVMRDGRTGRVLLEKGRQPSSPRATPPAAAPGELATEGVFAQGPYCPCVVIRVPMAGAPSRVLTLYLDPQAFQNILERVQLPRDGVSAIADRNGRFMARSVEYARRVGQPGSNSLRHAVRQGGAGLYRGVTLEGFQNYTAYATSPLTGWSGHVAIERKDIDSPRTLANASLVLGILAALVLAAGLMFYAAYETRRRRLEETRLIGMQKAEAISRFTGILAHDFRNILSVIDAGVRLILRHTREEETARRAQAIGDAAERGDRLVNQLLSFVRGDGAIVEALDLCKCLKGCEDLLRNSLGDEIAFSWSVDEDARHACANGDQLELALLNLAINARDAIDGPGTFTIAVTRDGDMAAVTACDSGPGVPPHLRGRIFETFYSTKGDGKGTGLGLAQVAGAARQAGGRVELRDNPAGGACFTIYLPLAEAHAG
jgi:signal transduction histidine kinase